MASIVSSRLVCGNCVNMSNLNVAKGYRAYCHVYRQYISERDSFCTRFVWNGVTASSRRLHRFPREDVQTPFLNA